MSMAFTFYAFASVPPAIPKARKVDDGFEVSRRLSIAALVAGCRGRLRTLDVKRLEPARSSGSLFPGVAARPVPLVLA